MTNPRFLKKILGLAFLLVISLFLFYEVSKRFEMKILFDKTPVEEKEIINFNRIDLSQPLDPGESKLIDNCLHPSTLEGVRTTLCLHDLEKDFTSRTITANGIKEKELLIPFLKYLKKNTDHLFLDVGTHVGLFTMFAAKLGRDVVSVEPFHDNAIRIHKASRIEDIWRRITLVKNAVSDKPNEIKFLQPRENIGQQSLVPNRNKIYSREDIKNHKHAKYFVDTIRLDDLVELISSDDTLKDYNKAIMKIDIEAYEPIAFRKAAKLFDALDIRLVFMEWTNLKDQDDLTRDINNMIKFFTNRSYIPFDPVDNERLDLKKWKNGWGVDVIWKKMDIKNE